MIRRVVRYAMSINLITGEDMGAAKRNPGTVSGQGPDSLERLREAVDEIGRAAARIEDRMGGPAGGYEALCAEIGAVVEAKISEALGGRTGPVAGAGAASSDVSAALGEIRGLAVEASAILRALRDDVGRLLDARSNNFIDALGPRGWR
jgi:hypothetical protein